MVSRYLPQGGSDSCSHDNKCPLIYVGWREEVRKVLEEWREMGGILSILENNVKIEINICTSI